MNTIPATLELKNMIATPDTYDAHKITKKDSLAPLQIFVIQFSRK